jgi:hypothetical protein
VAAMKKRWAARLPAGGLIALQDASTGFPIGQIACQA